MDTTLQNTVVLANLVELGQSIIAEVIGDDISNHIGSQEVRAQDVADTIVSNLAKHLVKHTGV